MDSYYTDLSGLRETSQNQKKLNIFAVRTVQDQAATTTAMLVGHLTISVKYNPLSIRRSSATPCPRRTSPLPHMPTP